MYPEIVGLGERVDSNPELAIPWWLLASYSYYHLNRSMMSDSLFDKLTAILKTIPREIIDDHAHGYLITEDGLSVGSAFDIKETDYPTIVKFSAMDILRDS